MVRVLVARYYDPTTAQFLTRDPIEQLTQQPYQYAIGDPLDLADPTGLFGWSSISHAAGWVAVGAGVVAVAAVTVAAAPVAIPIEASVLATTASVAGTTALAASAVETGAACYDAATGGPTSGRQIDGVLLMALGPVAGVSRFVELRAARAAYVSEAGRIPAIARDGREAVDMRNALKARAREGLPNWLTSRLERRNLLRYGDPLGPTYERLLARYGSDEAVRAAAGRTRLGVESALWPRWIIATPADGGRLMASWRWRSRRRWPSTPRQWDEESSAWAERVRAAIVEISEDLGAADLADSALTDSSRTFPASQFLRDLEQRSPGASLRALALARDARL